jgi:hypothetical protein
MIVDFEVLLMNAVNSPSTLKQDSRTILLLRGWALTPPLAW